MQWNRAWLTAALVVGAALAIRLAYLFVVPWHGHDLIVVDPDGYTVSALMISHRHFAASALFRSVEVFQFVRPPLYTVLLALISRLPGNFPHVATVFHACLGTAMVAAMFWLGYRVHSVRAGIIAALLGSVYWPFATGANIFVQEALYIPLLTVAFAVLVEVATRRAPPRAWAAAGGLFGLATLTRSMPLYYLAPALAVYVWRSGDRRRACREAGACLLAFAVVIAPYSIAISRHVHQVVLVENMGAITFPMRYPEARNAVHHTAPPPTVFETAAMLVRAFAAHPVGFTGERLADAALLVRLRGGRLLQQLEGVRTAAAARAYKWLIHVFDDGLFAVVCVLAPLGWALARNRVAGAFVASWILLNVALLTAFTFTGARYLAPCIPSLIVLAGVALAGGWTAPSKAGIAAAAAASGLVLYAIAVPAQPQLAGSAEYGLLSDRQNGATRRVTAIGESGVNLMPHDGVVTLTIAVPPEVTEADTPVRIEARVAGATVDSWTLPRGGSRTVRYVWPRSQLAYVELRASGAGGQAVPLVIDMPIGGPSEHGHE